MIARNTKICYNTMMISTIKTLALSAFCVIAFAPAAQAYVNPYDVLLANDLLLPPQPRMTEDRLDRQQRESAARRDEEQAAIFAEQHPPVLEELDTEALESELHGAAEEEIVLPDTPENMEMLSLMRALERIKDNQVEARQTEAIRQQAFLLLQENGLELHSGAPNDLAPTGAGTAIAIVVALAGIIWTIRRACHSSKLTRVHS